MSRFILCLTFYIFYMSIALINAKRVTDGELLFIQMVWRHGDRAPIQLYPTDPNSEDVWKEGLGQLTMLGRKQHYALGKLFRETYEDFITTNPREINVISSDCDRCMDSAEANLAAFYAPSAEWQFDNIQWQPLPIRYIPVHDDKYLETDSYCPEAANELQRVINSKEGQEFIKENWAMFQYLSNHSGKPITYWRDASYLYDVLKIEKKYNLSLPAWTSTYWDQLANVSNLSFYWNFKTPLLHRLRGGPLVGAIRDNIQDKISGKLPQQKVQIYSTHDSTIAAFLQALNLYNMKQPPYCTTFVVELYNLNNTYQVRFLYFNSSMPESGQQTPHVLILEGCTEFCPVDYFMNYTKCVVPDDWEVECKIKFTIFDINEKSVIAGLVFTILALLIIGVGSYALWRLHSRNRDEYSYQFLHSNINS